MGDNFTIVEFCLVPDRACWVRATASRAGPRWPWGSGVSRPAQRFLASGRSTIGLLGPAGIKFFLTWGSCNTPSNGGVSESTTMEPTGEAIVPQLAVREGAAFVCSITLVDGSVVARLSELITIPAHGKGNGDPLRSL